MRKLVESIKKSKSPIVLRDVNFPGHNLFNNKQQVVLVTSIQEIMEEQTKRAKLLQPTLSANPFDYSHVGTNAVNNYESAESLDRVNRLHGCMQIAVDTAHMMNRNLTYEQLIEISSLANLSVERIPQEVYLYFSNFNR